MIDLEEHQERIARLKESICERIETELDPWVVNSNIMSQIEKLAEESVEHFLALGTYIPEEEEYNIGLDYQQEDDDSGAL